MNIYHLLLKQTPYIKFGYSIKKVEKLVSLMNEEIEMHKKEVKRLKREIAELEAMQNRSCVTCKYSCEYITGSFECTLLSYVDQEGGKGYIQVNENFFCNQWEAKDE